MKPPASRLRRALSRLPLADRSIMLAPLVGVVAGLGAILFHVMCLVVTHYALAEFTGYGQDGPANERELHDIVPIDLPATPLRPWLLVLVPTLGGIVSGAIVYKFAPEAEGHGTDAAIKAYHHERGVISSKVPIVKMLASAITLGTGGSGGREGPIAQIGAGFGSYLATKLKLSDSERRALLAAGLGAGIGAIFHAPLAGAIFAIEVLYRDADFEAEALIPAFISTTVAYCVFCICFGFDSLFEVGEIAFDKPLLLAPLTVLALAMVVAAWLYVKTFYGIHNLFHRLPITNYAKPAIGSFLTGLFAVGLYYGMRPLGPEAQNSSLSVLSFGYGFLQEVLAGDLPAKGAIILLLAVGVGKAITTSLTIGSGGSGGVFGPSMVIGGALGAVIGLVFEHIGMIREGDVVMFVILGMASFFAAAANTPVSTLIMVSELTGSYTLLLPAMWVCALAYIIGGQFSLYKEQVATKFDSPAHRGDFIIDVLEGMSIRDALPQMTRDFKSVSLDTPMSEMSHMITETRQATFPVVDHEGQYFGLFGLNDIRAFLYDSQLAELAVAQDLAAVGTPPLTLQMDMSTAIAQFSQGGYEELPVVDVNEPDKIIGLLRRQDVIAAYSSRLLAMRSIDNDDDELSRRTKGK